MKIGTDVSLKTCSDEGYTMAEFKVRELYPNGRKAGIDKDHAVRFYANVPKHLRSQMTTAENPFGNGAMWESWISWNTLIELFEEHKDSVCSLVGMNESELVTDEPDEHAMLALADAINAYCGLN